jgi:hypothetical protein
MNNAYNGPIPKSSVSHVDWQGQIGSNALPPSPQGVVEMTASAHQAFEVLSQSIGDLISKVGPLVEPYPENIYGEAVRDHGCEAAAITHLRQLIERINEKTAEVQRLTAALRV